jgi:deoxyadenosine/deoxycytidine kinase
MQSLVQEIGLQVDALLETSKVCLLCIDGNIAAGKTTLKGIIRDSLASKSHWLTVREIEERVTEAPNNLFADYLDSKHQTPNPYCYDFQKWIVKDKTCQYESILAEQATQSKCVILMDRSFRADFEVFCHFYKEKFHEGTFAQICALHCATRAKYPSLYSPDILVYLDSSVSTCMKRILQRGIPQEEKAYSKQDISKPCQMYKSMYKQVFVAHTSLYRVSRDETGYYPYRTLAIVAPPPPPPPPTCNNQHTNQQEQHNQDRPSPIVILVPNENAINV